MESSLLIVICSKCFHHINRGGVTWVFEFLFVLLYQQPPQITDSTLWVLSAKGGGNSFHKLPPPFNDGIKATWEEHGNMPSW